MNTTPLIAYTIYRRYPDRGWTIWKRYKKHLGCASTSGVGCNRIKELSDFLTKLSLAE